MNLLDADPDLTEALAASDQRRLRGVLWTPVLSVDRRAWEPPPLEDGSIGLLVLEGLVMCRLSFGAVSSAELVGPGDILRPADKEAGDFTPPPSAWRALADVRLAVVDRRAWFVSTCPGLRW